MIDTEVSTTKHKRIDVNPNIMFAKPVIKGTRITVEQILRKLAMGMTLERIMEDHAGLTVDNMHAAEICAADNIREVIL